MANNNINFNLDKNEIVETIPLKQLGIRSVDSVINHLAKENNYNDNLISDVSFTDYLDGAKKDTCFLLPLDGLPPFIDDIYVVGYFGKEDCVIDENNLGEEPAGVFKIKITLSEIPMNIFFKKLRLFEYHLKLSGYGLMSIDVTQDFSGTLNRKELVKYLLDSGLVRKEKELLPLNSSKSEIINFYKHPVLIDNDFKNSGTNIVKYKYYNKGFFLEVKHYNKIVSNFEASDVQKKEGTHLSEYAKCPFNHLHFQTS